MTDEQKKPPEDPARQFTRDLKEAWKGTKEDIAWMRDEVAQQFKDTVSDPARDGINYATHQGQQVYNVAEKIVGRDRLIAAGLGAGKLGTLGMVGGPKGVIVGTFVGAAAGLIVGRPLTNWLKGGKQFGNDDAPPPADPPPDVKP